MENEIMDIDKLLKIAKDIAADAEYTVKNARKPGKIKASKYVAKTWNSITHYLEELKLKRDTNMRPQFKHITFKDIADFRHWLDKNTHIEILLKDNGLDLTKFWVHESGEIIHANAHSTIYNGLFIDVEKLIEGCPIRVWKEQPNEYVALEELVVEHIYRKEIQT
ncbi:MAG: hypothetical protein PHZ24_09060 [Bacteroidales bacterium]|nr:hypothetical protein [Bacteroidales bacterium]